MIFLDIKFVETRLLRAIRGPAAAVLALLLLLGCQPPSAPTRAEIESEGLRALYGGQAQARTRLRVWSEAGHPVAQREWALVLLHDPSTVPQALVWLERAAAGQDAEAAYLRGRASLQGRHGLPVDVPSAMQWLEQAANHGHADAALELARVWRSDVAGHRDEALALRWLELASEGGNAQAMLLLSNAYAQGQGTAVDLSQARRWLEASADRHYPPALQALSLALDSGGLGFDRDTDEAARLLKEAEEERRNRWTAR